MKKLDWHKRAVQLIGHMKVQGGATSLQLSNRSALPISAVRRILRDLKEKNIIWELPRFYDTLTYSWVYGIERRCAKCGRRLDLRWDDSTKEVEGVCARCFDCDFIGDKKC